MEKLLTSKNDELGFAKLIIRQLLADKNIATREIAAVRALLKAHGVPQEVALQAKQDMIEGKQDLPEMSKTAMAAAVLGALDVSLCDLDFSADEVQNIMAMGKELGMEQNEELTNALREYCKAHIAIFDAMEKEVESLGVSVPADQKMDAVFPSTEDKKCFVKCMMKVAGLDSKMAAGEEYFINNVSASYGISSELIDEAVTEFKAGNISFTVSTDVGKTAILRCAIRVACMDSNFDEKEQAAIVALSKEVGMEVDAAVIAKIAQYAQDKPKVYALREKAMKLWLSL